MRSDRLPIHFDCPSGTVLERDAAWWAIYDEAFPDSEREPRQVILDSIRDGVGLAVRARLDGATVGLATVHLLRCPPTVFLVYLAIARHLRGHSLGGSLLEEAWEVGCRRLTEQGLTAGGMIWEVDDPAGAATETERRQRERRVAFFARHRGRGLSRPYLQPPLHGTLPIPMRLMYRPAAETNPPDASTIEMLVRAMYFEKYGAANHLSADLLERLLEKSET